MARFVLSRRLGESAAQPKVTSRGVLDTYCRNTGVEMRVTLPAVTVILRKGGVLGSQGPGAGQAQRERRLIQSEHRASTERTGSGQCARLMGPMRRLHPKGFPGGAAVLMTLSHR